MNTKKQFLNLKPGDVFVILLMILVGFAPISLLSIPLLDQLKDHPCMICGKPAHHRKEVLYEYNSGKRPKAHIQYQWYCDKHVDNVPFVTQKKKVHSDSIGNRLFINFMLTLFGILVFGLSIMTLNINRWYFLIFPFLNTVFIMLAGPTHKWVTIFLGSSTIAFPGLTFILWYYYTKYIALNRE